MPHAFCKSEGFEVRPTLAVKVVGKISMIFSGRPLRRMAGTTSRLAGWKEEKEEEQMEEEKKEEEVEGEKEEL